MTTGAGTTDAGSTVRRGYEAMGRGDIPGLLALMAQDFVWREEDGMRHGGVYDGGQAVLEGVIAPLVAEFEGFAVGLEQIVDGGEGTVVALGRYTGRAVDTGRLLDVPFAHAWTVRDGLLTSLQQYTDSATFNQAYR